MTLANVFTKSLIRNNLPRLPSESTLRVATGASMSQVAIVNDDGTNPMIFKLERVGDLAILEEVSLTAETFKATIITDAVPDSNATWWFSRDSGTTWERAKFIKRETGAFGYHWVIYFQLSL